MDDILLSIGHRGDCIYFRAGAVAGIFKAPVAGIVFTLEILMLDLTISSIVPLLISSVTAATVSFFLMGKGVLFNFSVQETFSLGNIPWYIILGLFSGLFSLYFTRATLTLELMYEKIKNNYTRLVAGGLVLGVLILLMPPLYGEGYNIITELLNGNTSALFENSLLEGSSGNIITLLAVLAALSFFKVLATSSTNGAGGVGGIFAPSLFTGGINGFFAARLLNGFLGQDVPESSFILAGMAGAMAGIMHAPLTAIFLWGGETLKYFALALIIGMVAGTYSSIFLASPLLPTPHGVPAYLDPLPNAPVSA